MVQNIRKHGILMWIGIAFSIMSSMSLLITIFIDKLRDNSWITVVFGIMFWSCLVLEQIMFWQANKMIIALIKGRSRKFRGRNGFCSIATTFEGLIADVILVISIIALFVCITTNTGERLIQYILIFLVVLAFRMHCILNGKNYRYRKILKKEGKCNV